jgi:hypothetical protein
MKQVLGLFQLPPVALKDLKKKTKLSSLFSHQWLPGIQICQFLVNTESGEIETHLSGSHQKTRTLDFHSSFHPVEKLKFGILSQLCQAAPAKRFTTGDMKQTLSPTSVQLFFVCVHRSWR